MTSDSRADRPSLNLPLDQPLPETPDKVWAGDITYIPVGQGRLYFAVVIDLCYRRISAGWALAEITCARDSSPPPWDRL